MSSNSLYADAAVAVRDDLAAAHETALGQLTAAGTWWDGARRRAIAEEARRAMSCKLCQARKAALSANAVGGDHDSTGALPPGLVELIHRVRTDPGRLTQAFFADRLADGIDDAEYVETLGVVVLTVALDTFARGLGIAQRPLPPARAGEPSRQRPASAAPDRAWVPLLPRDDPAFESPHPQPNIARAMSLVPLAVRQFFALLRAQYMPANQVRDPHADGGRAISRTQMELLAARVSALNQCFY